MKNITLSVDDDTYRLARIKAAGRAGVQGDGGPSGLRHNRACSR